MNHIFKYKCKKCGKIIESDMPPRHIQICDLCGAIDIPLYSVDLYYVKPQFSIKIIEDELLRRDMNIEYGEYERPHFIWTDKKGKKVEISKMSSTHLRNIISFLEAILLKERNRELHGIKS